MINPIGIHKGEVTAHHDIFINPHTFNVDSINNIDSIKISLEE